MVFVSIASVLWRQKWLAIPIILLAALAGYYLVTIKPPVYDATSAVLLTEPPKQATQSQIAADPSLKKANSDNIFVDYGDLDIVANAVIDLATSPASRTALTKAGAGTGYQLALSTDFGNPPIIDITGTGSTAGAAVDSARVLTAAVQRDLVSLQLGMGVSPFYLIGGDNIVKPSQAQQSMSAKLRPLAPVIGGGIVLLFIVVSSADAVARRRRDRRAELALADDQYDDQIDDGYGLGEDQYEPAYGHYEPAIRGPFEALR